MLAVKYLHHVQAASLPAVLCSQACRSPALTCPHQRERVRRWSRRSAPGAAPPQGPALVLTPGSVFPPQQPSSSWIHASYSNPRTLSRLAPLPHHGQRQRGQVCGQRRAWCRDGRRCGMALRGLRAQAGAGGRGCVTRRKRLLPPVGLMIVGARTHIRVARRAAASYETLMRCRLHFAAGFEAIRAGKGECQLAEAWGVGGRAADAHLAAAHWGRTHWLLRECL